MYLRNKTLIARPGRGAAMCAGAAAAQGEVLFFLHADSVLPAGGLDCINEVLNANANIIGGNFRLVFDGDTLFSRWLTVFCAWIRLLGHYYGDSGVFVRRSVYDALGGFRPIPVMEDLEFVRRLERFGPTTCIKDPHLVTSSRRFERRRPVAIVYGWVRLHVLFWLAYLQTGWLKSIGRRRHLFRNSAARDTFPDSDDHRGVGD